MIKKIADENIFKRLRSGEVIPMNDQEYELIREVVHRTKKLSCQLNATDDAEEIHSFLCQITATEIDKSTVVFTPFYTNIGINITLGKNVFINHACSFLDLGGITIEDEVMIGPNVTITSENHPISISERKSMVPAPVLIKKNAWIGAGAIILPGVTIGENAVVAAGAVVNKDVLNNTVVAGVPAKWLKNIED